MGTELEWKLAVPEAGLQDQILRDPEVCGLAAEPLRCYHMQSAYYDTPDRRLSSRRITLRHRMENETSVVCMKAPLPDAPDPHMHGEWELEGEDVIAALPRLAALGAPADLPEAEELTCVCRADYRRRALLLRFADGSEGELALDHGLLIGRTASLPLCELELEMKSGDPGAALALLSDLKVRYRLTPQETSKYARASSLP